MKGCVVGVLYTHPQKRFIWIEPIFNLIVQNENEPRRHEGTENCKLRVPVSPWFASMFQSLLPLIKSFLFRFTFLFVTAFLLTFPFPYALLPDTGNFCRPVTETLSAWTAEHIFHSEFPEGKIVSDSTAAYVHVFNLVIIALIVAAAWTFFAGRKEHPKLCDLFFAGVRYYLAMQLLFYGFDKIFKLQFYRPEPNLLYTPLGQLHRMSLYWSAMGSSYAYTVFSGALEVFAGMLLVFRRTTLFGAIVSAGVMLNVVMINFGFDISVKLYSMFLLLLCFVVLAPQAKRLFAFFFAGKTTAAVVDTPFYHEEKWKHFYPITKTILIVIIFVNALSLFIRIGNYNDDKFPRPPMHGAYETELFIFNGDTLSANDEHYWKRFFVHRLSYFITQDANDQFTDHDVIIDTTRRRLILDLSSDLEYEKQNDSSYIFRGKLGNDRLEIHSKKIRLEELPLLQEEFRWTVE